MKLSVRDTAFILAGLRCLQQVYEECDGDLPGDIADIIESGGIDTIGIDLEEIDELCLKLNGDGP